PRARAGQPHRVALRPAPGARDRDPILNEPQENTMNTDASSTERRYQSGFGNEYATEAVPGALPQGRNSPQRAPFDLYPELISGTAFTAPRHENRRSWLYRRQPSVVTGRYQPYAQPLWTTGGDRETALAPEPMRWHPIPFEPGAETDFVDG